MMLIINELASISGFDGKLYGTLLLTCVPFCSEPCTMTYITLIRYQLEISGCGDLN